MRQMTAIKTLHYPRSSLKYSTFSKMIYLLLTDSKSFKWAASCFLSPPVYWYLSIKLHGNSNFSFVSRMWLSILPRAQEHTVTPQSTQTHSPLILMIRFQSHYFFILVKEVWILVRCSAVYCLHTNLKSLESVRFWKIYWSKVIFF